MPRVRIPRGTDMVSVTCYNQTECLTRQEALDKYYEAMVCCEGSERDRYLQIYTQLIDGCTDCYDC